MCVTDLELAERFRQGDDAAFHELVDRYAGMLFGLAVSLVGDPPDAEDVVQETFAGAFRRLGYFEGRSSLKTWLVRILVRQAAKRRRSRDLRKTVSIDDLSEASRSVLENARSASPTADVDIRMDVMTMLEVLSTDHRQVIVLRELQGMSYDEMAQALSVPRGTVESRLFRARRELNELLKAYLP